MTLTPPKSMSEVYYHTFRVYPDGGKVRAWAYKLKCPECKEGILGKELNEKTGKVKIRSKKYVCSNCDFTCEQSDIEKLTKLEAIYTCPHCMKEGESTAPFKRKTYKGVLSYVVICEHCGEKIGITKKMKEPKTKKSKA